MTLIGCLLKPEYGFVSIDRIDTFTVFKMQSEVVLGTGVAFLGCPFEKCRSLARIFFSSQSLGKTESHAILALCVARLCGLYKVLERGGVVLWHSLSFEVEHAQIVGCFGTAIIGRDPKPVQHALCVRVGIVGRENSEIELCLYLPLIRCCFKEFIRFFLIFGDAFTGVQQKGIVAECIRMALLTRFAIPLRCLSEVDSSTFSTGKHIAELVLGFAVSREGALLECFDHFRFHGHWIGSWLSCTDMGLLGCYTPATPG